MHSREGSHLFVYPFCGRLANEGIATLVAARWARESPQTFSVGANDYGFELLSANPIEVSESRLQAALSTDNLAEDLLAGVNLGEISRRQFRDIARIAGLVFQGFPGRGKSTRQIQASSSLVFDVLNNYDPDNLLLRQSRLEVLQAQLEFVRIAAALRAAGRPPHPDHNTAAFHAPGIPALGQPPANPDGLHRILATANRARRAATRGPGVPCRLNVLTSRCRASSCDFIRRGRCSGPARSTLVVADPHFGKDDIFRRAGIALPRGPAIADLQRLTELVIEHACTRLVVLGDFLHGVTQAGDSFLQAFRIWRQAHGSLTVDIVVGNHDRREPCASVATARWLAHPSAGRTPIRSGA